MNRIKELRRALNIKQVDLCKQIGVTQGALSGWENGKYEPDIKSLHKLAEIFNVSIDYLLGREGKSNPLEAFDNIFPIEIKKSPFWETLLAGNLYMQTRIGKAMLKPARTSMPTFACVAKATA